MSLKIEIKTNFYKKNVYFQVFIRANPSCSNVTWELMSNITELGKAENTTYRINNFVRKGNQFYMLGSRNDQFNSSQRYLFRIRAMDTESGNYKIDSFFSGVNSFLYASKNEHCLKYSKYTIAMLPLSGCWQASCDRLFFEPNSSLFCLVKGQHKVLKYSITFIRNYEAELGSEKLVAGKSNNQPGSSDYDLCDPQGIFVDHNSNLFVADTGNNRIQLFELKTNISRTIFHKNQTSGTDFDQPIDLTVDRRGSLYILCQRKNREFVWYPEITELKCIISCSSGGSDANILNQPMRISLDWLGYMFITDKNYHRIQQFQPSNFNCGEFSSKIH